MGFAGASLAAGWAAFGNRRGSSRAFAVPEIDVAKAKALLDAGAIVIDVRGQRQFDARHLPGALLIPLAALRVAIPAGLSQARERQVVVYCSDGVSTGPEATDILVRHGFRNASNLKGGVEAWASAGLPLVKGSA